MKTVILLAIGISIWACVCADAGSSDNLSLLGISKEELISRYGEPKDILGPANGYQTYEYSNGLAVVVHNQKVAQFVAKGASKYETEKRIKIGSDISEVAAKYGNYISTEKATDWFSGNKQNVLYHFEKFDRFKINYADDNLIIFLDPQKKVEAIMVGYIFPRE